MLISSKFCEFTLELVRLGDEDAAREKIAFLISDVCKTRTFDLEFRRSVVNITLQEKLLV